MNRFATRLLRTALAATAACVGTGAFLVGRVLLAERQSMRPPVLPTRAGDRAAIIVFGAETLPTGPSRELAARLRHALGLFDQGLASVIVVSGGTVVDDQGRTLDETADMAAWLIDHGVPADAVIPGLPGGNTRQTVATMARMTRDAGLHPWLAVSTPYHAQRILDEARRVGVDVVVSGPADSPEMLAQRVHRSRVLTEALAAVYYVLPSTVTAQVRTSAGTWRHRIPLLLAGRDE